MSSRMDRSLWLTTAIATMSFATSAEMLSDTMGLIGFAILATRTRRQWRTTWAWGLNPGADRSNRHRVMTFARNAGMLVSPSVTLTGVRIALSCKLAFRGCAIWLLKSASSVRMVVIRQKWSAGASTASTVTRTYSMALL